MLSFQGPQQHLICVTSVPQARRQELLRSSPCPLIWHQVMNGPTVQGLENPAGHLGSALCVSHLRDHKGTHV